MKRVCFVNRYCHPDHSATSQIMSDLAAALVERGWEVTMVASRQRYDDPDALLPRRENWRGVTIERIRTTRFGRAQLAGRMLDYLTFYVSLPFALFRLLRRGDVVVAKTDPPLVSVMVALVARLRGALLVNWLQDLFPELVSSLGTPRIPQALAWCLRTLRNLSLKSARMNVAIGSRMATHLAKQGEPEEKIRVIQNWAHEETIAPVATSHSQLRRELGLGSHFVVGYSGNLGRVHDVDTLLDGVLLLRDTKAIAFLVIGGGHGYELLRRRAGEESLANIQFLPYQPLENLSDSLAAADLHLVSLRPELEGQIVPSKFYGIAASARPVGFIGDTDGEVARLIARGNCGFSVPSGRGDLLAEAISRLALDPEACWLQGQRARELLDGSLSRTAAHLQWHQLLSGLEP